MLLIIYFILDCISKEVESKNKINNAAKLIGDNI